MTDAAAPAPVNLVFLVGTGRCGSTLLHEVLARHPAVGFVSNIDNLVRRGRGRVNRAVYQRVPPAFTEKGRARFAPSEAYELLAREVSPLLGEPFRDLRADDLTPWLRERLERFFLGRAEAQGVEHFLHKFTGWPRVGFLHAAFPQARFVHVVRDGRAVANSWLQMPWWRGHLGPSGWHFGPLPPALEEEWERSGRSFVVLAGLAWKLLMDAYDEASRALPPQQWLQIRHEDLCADPDATLQRVLDFAGLPPSATFDAAVRTVEFRTERPGRVESQLGTEAYRALEGSLAEHLRRYGYTTG